MSAHWLWCVFFCLLWAEGCLGDCHGAFIFFLTIKEWYFHAWIVLNLLSILFVDDEERMDEMAMEQPRAWERPRKERISSTINPRSKRRRHTGFSHESHVSGRLNVRPEDAEESAEDTEMAASEDEDEPPPPPPLIRRPLKPRTHPKVIKYAVIHPWCHNLLHVLGLLIVLPFEWCVFLRYILAVPKFGMYMDFVGCP